jgi:hypothetical protein
MVGVLSSNIDTPALGMRLTLKEPQPIDNAPRPAFPGQIAISIAIQDFRRRVTTPAAYVSWLGRDDPRPTLDSRAEDKSVPSGNAVKRSQQASDEQRPIALAALPIPPTAIIPLTIDAVQPVNAPDRFVIEATWLQEADPAQRLLPGDEELKSASREPTSGRGARRSLVVSERWTLLISTLAGIFLLGNGSPLPITEPVLPEDDRFMGRRTKKRVQPGLPRSPK